MAASQFPDHFPDDVVEIQAGLGVRHQDGIFVFDGVPVHPVHVFQIETVAVGPPGFIKDLRPFLFIVHKGYHVVGWHGIVQRGLSGGHRHHIEPVAQELVEEGGAQVGRGIHHRHFGHQGIFLALQVIDAGVAVLVVPYLVAVADEVAVVSGGQRQFQDTALDAGSIDTDTFILLGFRLFLAGFGIVGWLLECFHFGILFQERRRRVVLQQGDVDAAHFREDMVPFHAAVNRVVIAVRIENEVFPIAAEHGRIGTVPFFGNREFFLAV